MNARQIMELKAYIEDDAELKEMGQNYPAIAAALNARPQGWGRVTEHDVQAALT